MSNSNVVVIPARGGSEGIKNKNIQEVGGQPLVIRSLSHALEFNSSFSIIVSTDSQVILDVVTDFLGLSQLKLMDLKFDSIHDLGPIAVHYRSQEFSDSNAIIGTALKDLRLLCKESMKTYGCWVLLQPTSPYRSKDEIHEISNKIIEKFGPNDSWVSVKKVDDSHPARMYELDSGSNKLVSLKGYEHVKAVRRQDLEPVYLRDGAFYCISDSLVALGKQFSDVPTPIIRTGPWTINIDNEMDLALARLYSDTLIE
jgi:CMP-N,N'-diacetyllegionaminic acid synthase